MRCRKMAAGAAALVLALALPMAAQAKEEREPVGKITLTISASVETGGSGGIADASVDEGECSVDSVEFVNEPDYWEAGMKPKIEIWLSADSDYYFKKSGKSAFKFEGDEVKYVSSSTRNDRSELKLTLSLEKLEKDESTLEVEGIHWDEANAIAQWDALDTARYYSVRLCRRTGTNAIEDGVGVTYTTNQTSYDFSSKITRPGDYYFKVRAIDSRGNAGDWQEASYMEVSEADVAAWTGVWKQDGRGWWYLNHDGSYTKDGWQEIGGRWYFFDAEGYMKSGWIEWQGKRYYCDASGAMLVSATTPDGAQVGADGAQIN